MTNILREHARLIYEGAIYESLPNSAVKKAILEMPSYNGRLVLVAIGKAGYAMAESAYKELGDIDNAEKYNLADKISEKGIDIYRTR